MKNLLKKIKDEKSVLVVIELCITMALISSFIFEITERLGNFPQTISWIAMNAGTFAISTAFIFFIYLFFTALIGNYNKGIILCFLLFGITAFANIEKLKILGAPIYPVDFLEIKNASTILSMLGGKFIVLLIIGIIIVFTIIKFIVKLLPKNKPLKLPSRILLTLISLFFIYTFVNYKNTFINKYYIKSGVSEVLWDQRENYDENGFMFGLLSNIKSDVMEKPTNYSEAEVTKVAEKYKQEADKLNAAKTSEGSLQPNIIYIMDEAFWDPTRMTSLSFSEDPMQNIRTEMASNSSGYLLSPVFGGGTANTEYEALTGFSMYNNIAGTIPYQQAMDKEKFVPSIVSILKQQNYNTLAIHAYEKIFYKRDVAYKTLGFDKFIGDTDMKYQDTQVPGGYISDQSVVNEILYQLNQSSKPTFIHAVTMQNHFPFNEGKYPQNTVTVSGLSTAADTNELETYTQGIKSTDEAMKTLFDGLAKMDRPTIVVFFGDHLPALSNSIYNTAKFGTGSNALANEKALSETPLLIYSNFGLQKTDLKTISPSFLGVTLFDMLNKPLNPYYTMLDDIKQTIPGLKSSVQVDSKGNVKTSLTDDEKQLLADYKLIQYDLMEGKQYSLPILFGK
ncbi:LTA synthase family protein [Candidatus Clostridium stratigraminis]|uniref:LTA synthase family protein n=1 Tax=Candidatus Clostridium stratigraminis TaxID=3381661 RepID=A0ABW8T3Y0_9CLOT